MVYLGQEHKEPINSDTGVGTLYKFNGFITRILAVKMPDSVAVTLFTCIL